MEYFTHADTFAMQRLWSAVGPAIFVGLYFLIGLVAYGVRCTIYGRFRDAEIDARGSSVLLNNWARTYFAWVMRPVWHFLQSAEIPPNAVTSVSVLLALAAGTAAALGQFSLGGWLYLCSGVCDFLDGRLARATGKATASGAALDSILDRYSEGAMLIGLAWYYRDTWVLLGVLAFLAGSFLVPYVRARGEGLGIHLKVGLMQRPERVVILGVAVAFSPFVEAWWAGDVAHPFYWLTVLAVMLLAVSTQFTAAHRLVAATHALNAKSGPTEPLRIGRSSIEPVWMALSVMFDFLLVIFMAEWLGWPVWWATAVGSLCGTALQFVMSRAWTLDRGAQFDTHAQCARFVVGGIGSALLNSGGVAILLLVPDVAFWLPWCIVRVAVLLAWNYPMRRAA
jgi:phosphatidylglycerophosphate synthase/putative flippase GtrA